MKFLVAKEAVKSPCVFSLPYKCTGRVVALSQGSALMASVLILVKC